MADGSDDGSHSQRESHYNQQRSSLRSDRSLRTPSRPGSSQLLQQFTLSDDNIAYHEDPYQSPSPSPVIPMRRTSSAEGHKQKGSKSGRSRRGSSRGLRTREGRSHSGSEGRNLEEYNVPDSYGNINEILAPAPVENPREQRLYAHSTLEEERTPSRTSKKAQRSARSSFQPRATPRSRTPGSVLDLTALPQVRGRPGSPGTWSRYKESKAESGRQRASWFATELYTISYLIFFSIWGTLARLGLQWLTFYPGAPVVFSELWANFAGTLFMGFLAEDSRLFKEEWGKTRRDGEMNDEEKALQLDASQAAAHSKVKKSIPLYIGLATGFCGSFTSFSSFMRDAFFALSNDMPTPVNHPYPSGLNVSTSSTIHRNGGYSFMAVLAVLIITIGLCYSAFKFGAHLAIYSQRLIPTLSFFLWRRVIDPVMVILSFGLWLGAVFMAIWPPDRPGGPNSKGSWANETWRGQAIFACAFAPVGCLLRFYMSLRLNGIMPSFPLGTFAVNIFGTAVLGMAYDLQHVDIGSGLPGGGHVSCQILQGIMDGFCGTLTTVSTWIAEINGLKRNHSYVYAFTSTAIGLGALVIVMGSVRWTVGWTEAACVT
ncbi:CrcB-like protein-domain-containing protein [Lophiotrema nucula]|uniref:CrcB-like protein-domain-containing protein n=1 Tax=Lophiotrema nucula TaxID=690887 RepID=A0A6A5Z2G2_9PLEO|nr:CrcB-like protein-domain-containing protein [Lophiotrema nucula]